jgi:hypothetical protein
MSLVIVVNFTRPNPKGISATLLTATLDGRRYRGGAVFTLHFSGQILKCSTIRAPKYQLTSGYPIVGSVNDYFANIRAHTPKLGSADYNEFTLVVHLLPPDAG